MGLPQRRSQKNTARNDKEAVRLDARGAGRNITPEGEGGSTSGAESAQVKRT